MSLIIAKNKIKYEQLLGVETPAPTESFMPIPHYQLVDLTREAITRAGLTILEEEHSLARDGQRYFGGFALTGEGMDGADRRVVLGLRNSSDRSFAAAICLGSQMLVCENLSFSASIKLARRHTLNILADLPRVLANAVGMCVSHWNDMGKRIETYKEVEIADAMAADLLVRLVDAKAFPSRDIYNAITEFRNPRHEEFKGGTLWTLYNAITQTLKGGDLAKLPFRTMSAHAIFDRISGHRPVIEVQEIVTRGSETNPDPDGADMRQEAGDEFEPLVIIG